MAFNPFLSMGEPVAPVSSEVLNPFMISDPEISDFAGDNPFSTSNPFSDFGGDLEPAAGDTVPTDIFGTGEPCPARLTKPTELALAPPSRTLPPETQTLLQSVTGHMELTSSHLLQRLPPTRPPSPLLPRDLASPGASPEPELGTEMTPERTPERTPAATPEPPTTRSPPDSLDINRNKPARPPPARPAPPSSRSGPPSTTNTVPPRPAPPPPPSRPHPPAPSQSTTVNAAGIEDINLFDAPLPSSAKPTMEDILSLYSAPKHEQEPVDFLSDDFMDNISADPGGDVSTVFTSTAPTSLFTNVVDSVATVADSVATAEAEVSFTAPMFSETSAAESAFASLTQDSKCNLDTVAPMDCSEPPAESGTADTSPFDDFTKEEMETYRPDEDIKNPFDNFADNTVDAESSSSFVNETVDHLTHQPGNIFGVNPANTFGLTNNDNIGATEKNAFGISDENSFSTKEHNAFESMQTDVFDNSQQPFSAADNYDGNQMDVFSSDAHQMGTQGAADWGSEPMAQDAAFPDSQDAFDAFSAKFDNTSANHISSGAWGSEAAAPVAAGFEADAFDPFLAMEAPPPAPPPAAPSAAPLTASPDGDDDNFSVFIRPKDDEASGGAVPALPPPPRAAPPDAPPAAPPAAPLTFEAPSRRTGSTPPTPPTPPTPLFDEDTSVPLEPFPRTEQAAAAAAAAGWEMHLRQPNKKKITGQRFWKKIFVRLSYQGDNPVVQLFNSSADREPFQELPLQACYSVSEIGAQQFDQFGKIFTVKLQYIFYKERPGVRPGQVTKAERLTTKLSQFAAYAIQGDYQGVKEFGSDLRKLGLPVEHAPQVSQLFKIGSLNYEHVKQFSSSIEEALFRLPAHRDRALTYKMEEVQITAVDELYVEQDAEGSVQKQIARVRLFFLGFLSGMPDVELGVNDLRRQGREVVGRHDIIPVATEEWIRVEDSLFHACVQPEHFAESQIIRFKPPDACYIELMRFRVRPPKNRELPLQLKASWCVTGNKVELRADVLVPGFASRALGQVPCEDVCVRFPIPECWIYLFRTEKHFRYGSVKSAHRRTGKIKGIERFLGAVETPQESLIEVTSGLAKYEHQHRAVVWRMPRLPKDGQGAYTTHNLVCRMALTSYDQIPAELAPHAFVEFTMPATQVSHMTVRSVTLQNYDGDPPEKYVRYLARHEYVVGIERITAQEAPAYAAAARVAPTTPAAAPPTAPAAPQPPSSDSDSD